MLRVKEGDLDSLSGLYDRYSRPLYGFFMRQCRDQEQSEDLVQTVFLRVLKYRHTYREEGNFRTWVYHLARNVYADQFRKKNPLMHSTGLNAVAERKSEMGNPEGLTQKLQERELLQKAMDRLPEDKRELLVLARYQEMPYAEIAELLDVSEGAIKVRVHRCMNDLKKIYMAMIRERAHEN